MKAPRAAAMTIYVDGSAASAISLPQTDTWRTGTFPIHLTAGHANSVGGVVNEWTDSWWGHNPGSTAGLDVHDTDADYLNWAYFNDVLYPYPNVNPEWGGLTSQGKRKIGRHPIKQPRAAYYALQYLWKVDPVQLAEERTKGTAGGVTLESHLAGLDLGTFTARGMTDSQENIPNWKVTTDISFAAMQSGNNIEQRLDEGEEFIMLFDNNSSPNNTNIWGGEVKTTLWGITNESAAGRLEGAATVAVRHDVVTGEGYSSIINQTTSSALKERPVDFYSGWFKWSGAGAAVNGFYHVGHASWEGQGDFFSIIPESYDITGYDKLNNKAPIGVEASYNFGLSGNQGLAVLLGPEPYYGSGPLAALKWYQKIENVSFSALYSQGFAAYNKETKKVEKPESMASLWTSWQPKMPQNGSFRADIGMLSAGWQKIGDTFEVAPDKKGEITLADTLGVKARLQYSPIQYFATQMQFDYAGLVADTNGGTTPIGSLLADNGHGNRIEAKGGVTGSYGNYQLRLNALWRQPIIGPIADTTTARALAQANPFYVSGNREALRFEAILSYDSEPGSWLWAYNNADLEGGVFAGSLIARYTAWEGATDPGHYKQDDGTRMWYSTGLSRVENEFSAALRTVFNPLPDLRIVNSAALIKGQAIAGTWNTERDSRLITGFQEDLKVRYQRLVVDVLLAFDLWGTVSWQRDMNYTYPMRWASELAWSFRPVPSLMNSSDRVGLRWRGVIRDHFSPKFTELGKDSHEIELFFNITI
ncbi:hypothetical protein AGMMS50267_00660 [Spirochaetia bacterium]|nr:hypothetical protein AGMMS50267_00660 [Spirochaetia bacterium]